MTHARGATSRDLLCVPLNARAAPGLASPVAYPLTMATTVAGRDAARLWPVGLVLVLPLVGLAALLVQPELDMAWEHHPAHFWIVLIAAAVNVVLAYVTNIAAGRYRDARLTLISLAFLSTAGFLGLHALVTPGVLLDTPNIGFAIATPVGLIVGSVFAGRAATPLAGPRAMDVLRVRNLLLGGLIAADGRLGHASIARLPPLDGPPPPREGGGVLDILSIVAIGLFGFAAVQLVRFWRYRDETILLATAAAFGPPRRGPDRDPCQPELALQLVGMAPPAAGSVPDHRPRRAQRISAKRLADRRVRRAVPRGHASARRSLVRGRGGLRRCRAGRGERNRRRPRRAPTGGRHRPGADAALADGPRGQPAQRQLPSLPAVRRHRADPPPRHVLAGGDDRRRSESSRPCSPTSPDTRRSASATSRARWSRC